MKDFEIQTFIDDRDKKEYQAIKVGKLLIMSQNLACTTFNNGDPIPIAKDAIQWEKEGSFSKPVMCHYAYNASLNSILGYYYNAYVLKDSRGITPLSWRIPKVEDFRYIISYIEKKNRGYSNKVESNYFDNMLYEKMTIHKTQPMNYLLKSHISFSDVGLKNDFINKDWAKIAKSYGNPLNFSALPAGYCNKHGLFQRFGESAGWWAEAEDEKFNRFVLDYYSMRFSEYTNDEQNYGYSLRCVKDI